MFNMHALASNTPAQNRQLQSALDLLAQAGYTIAPMAPPFTISPQNQENYATLNAAQRQDAVNQGMSEDEYRLRYCKIGALTKSRMEYQKSKGRNRGRL
jgi:hypothetical protein